MSISVVGPVRALESALQVLWRAYLVRAAGRTSTPMVHARSVSAGSGSTATPTVGLGCLHRLRPFPDTMYETARIPLEDASGTCAIPDRQAGHLGADIDIAAEFVPFIDGTVVTPSAVVVAVLDSGIDTHIRILPVHVANPDEVPANGIDDDGNGYVDDMYRVGTSSTMTTIRMTSTGTARCCGCPCCCRQWRRDRRGRHRTSL